MSRKNITLNVNERSDVQFLFSLSATLSNYDLSGKIFVNLVHIYSVLQNISIICYIRYKMKICIVKNKYR